MELEQKNYKMTIIKDLGEEYINNSKLKKRCALFRCQECNKNIKLDINLVSTKKMTVCPSCHKNRNPHGPSRYAYTITTTHELAFKLQALSDSSGLTKGRVIENYLEQSELFKKDVEGIQ